MINVFIEKVPAGGAEASATVSLKLPAEASLRHKRQTLEYFWQQGASGRSLLRKHTELIDTQLALNFANCSEAAADFSLVALGGYGRCELFPFSDIDLLLLYAHTAEDKVKRVAEAILYPLWDAGLEVGHGVRTPAACLADAEADYFFQVALLDARLIAGSPALFNELREQFEAKFIQGRRAEFCATMQAHRGKRLERFGAHSYMLEPHIKESRGGLRDIQAMLWAARVVFGLAGIEAMEEAGLLTAPERTRFEQAWEQLIKIRNRLHYVSGRKNDQLYFEHQEEMAKAFNYRKRDGFLGVEHFMRDVYGAMHTVAVAANLFFEHTDEVLGRSQSTREDDRLLAPGLELRGGLIHVSETELANNHALLLKAFAHAARTGAALHHRSRRLIRDNLGLVDDHFRHSRRLAKIFLSILTDAQEPLAVLEAMHETELLFAYIPEFGEVRSLAQHDVYHVFTADFHLLHTVAELHALRREMPLIFQMVATPHLLFLAALLHDIGKGQGKGHAERGARLAAAIGERMGLSSTETTCLAFLIRNHLYLPHIAMRRDLEDETLILRCAQQIEDPRRLAMLHLLAIADARATGPNAWGQWRAALLQELYLKIAHVLDSSLTGRPDRQQGAQWLRQRVAELLGPQLSMDLAVLPDEYLLSFTPEEVVRHISRLPELTGQEVLVFPEDLGDHWSLLIMTHDRPGLLSRICGTLALRSLRVLAARIFTWPDGTVVDVLEISSLVGEAFAELDWQDFCRDLMLAMNHRLGLDHRLNRKLAPMRRSTALPPSRRPPEVVFDNESSEGFTVIEVFADDRTGLLYEITRTLADFGVDISRAKISTKVDQIVDVFYVRDLRAGKILDTNLQEEIRQELLHVVKTQ